VKSGWQENGSINYGFWQRATHIRVLIALQLEMCFISCETRIFGALEATAAENYLADTFGFHLELELQLLVELIVR